MTYTTETVITTKTVTVDPKAAGSVTVTMGKVESGDKQGAIHTSGLDIPMDGFSPNEKIDLDQLDGDDLVFVSGLGIVSAYDLMFMYGYNVNSIVSKGALSPSQYAVTDKDGKVHVVYCADMSVVARSDVEYYLANVEDADYYTDSWNHGPGANDIKDPSYGAHLREVATNGYWGTETGTGSLEKLVGDLLAAKAAGNPALDGVTKDEIHALNADLALSATQAAVWRYGNSLSRAALPAILKDVLVEDGEGLDYDPDTATFTRVTEYTDPETGLPATKTTWTFDQLPGMDVREMIEVKRDENGVITNIKYPEFVGVYMKMVPDRWLNGTAAAHVLIAGTRKDSYENQMAMAVYNYLCGLESDKDKTTDLIKPSDIVEAVTNVKGTIQDGNDTKYEADVSFVLTVEPDRLNGDLLATPAGPFFWKSTARRTFRISIPSYTATG